MNLVECSGRNEEKTLDPNVSDFPERNNFQLPPLDNVAKGRWERTWPTIACGAGLFSDGYLNS